MLTDSARVHAIAPSSHDASKDHLRDTESGGLECGTNAEYYTAEHDALPATEFLSKGEAECSSEEATDFVDGDDSTLKRRATTTAIGGINFGEGTRKGHTSKQATHNTLIITKEKET